MSQSTLQVSQSHDRPEWQNVRETEVFYVDGVEYDPEGGERQNGYSNPLIELKGTSCYCDAAGLDWCPTNEGHLFKVDISPAEEVWEEMYLATGVLVTKDGREIFRGTTTVPLSKYYLHNLKGMYMEWLREREEWRGE